MRPGKRRNTNFRRRSHRCGTRDRTLTEGFNRGRGQGLCVLLDASSSSQPGGSAEIGVRGGLASQSNVARETGCQLGGAALSDIAIFETLRATYDWLGGARIEKIDEMKAATETSSTARDCTHEHISPHKKCVHPTNSSLSFGGAVFYISLACRRPKCVPKPSPPSPSSPQARRRGVLA